MNDRHRSSRREFSKSLALLAAAPLLTHSATAQDAKALEPLAAAAVDLSELLRRRHGKDLTPEQLKAIQQSIFRGLLAAERMNQVKLANSDEPAFVFSADVP